MHDSQRTGEKRRDARLNCGFRVHFQKFPYDRRHSTPTSSSTINLSAGGILLESPIPFEEAQMLDLVVNIPDLGEVPPRETTRPAAEGSLLPFRAIGEVVRCCPSSESNGHNVAIQFTCMDDAQAEALREYIDTKLDHAR